MSLHELPKEIVHSILRGLMSSVGVPKAFELRCVNSRSHVEHELIVVILIWVIESFDENIQIAAFTLPICSQDVFCNPWPDPRTSSPIMSRFVLFKTTPRGSTKRLTKTIEQTLSFYALHLNVQPLGQASWRHSLATAMVEFLPVQEVVRHLNTDSVSEKKENFTTLENALIGSIYNEDERAVVYFLQKDARPELQTAFFGDALSAAARRGNARIFRHVLRHLESMVSLDKQVFRVRILKSFVIASENGYLDVILELLEHTKPVPEFQELLESAISTAVRNSHRRVVRLLLSFVDNAASDHHRRRFSSTLLENAVRSRNAELVQDVLECLTRGVVLYASDTIKALEIAVQYQLTEIARSILRYMPVNEQDLSQQQMLYWAGRKGNAAILDLIMPDSITSNIDSIFDFLSGAVKREVSDRAALLEKVLSRTSKDADLAGSFSEVVDQILEDGTYLREASSRSVKSSLVQHSLNANLALETNIDQAPPMAFAGPFASQSPPEAILLVQACSEGQMRCVGDLLRVCKAQYGDENLTILYACFTEAIRHQKPAVLSYLLERLQQYFPPDIGSHCKSTAMFQILLDSGWNINHIGNRLHPPALG